MGLPRSTVQRIAAALQAEALLVPAGPAGGLRLGPALMRLAASVQTDVAAELRPLLRGLADRLGETVDLAEVHGSSVVFIDQIAGTQRLRAVSGVGEVFPLHCTANGKAYLATLRDAQIIALIGDHYPRHTPRTHTSWVALRDDLEEVRQAGVAFDLEENSEGICAAGVALQSASSPALVVSVPVPAARFAAVRAQVARELLALRARLDAVLRGLA